MNEIRKFDKDQAQQAIRRILGWHLDAEAITDGLVADLLREAGNVYGDGRGAGVDYACDRWQASIGGSSR